MEGTASAQNSTEAPPSTQQHDQQSEREPSSSNSEKPHSDPSMYECNICLDTAQDAVISMCGHLFCWPCLHQWLETRPKKQLCPVCKSAIGKDKVIPLYGRGGDNKDPREKVPPRPQGQRTEPSGTAFTDFNLGNGPDTGFQFSFGIGAFPFTFFASTLNFGEQRPSARKFVCNFKFSELLAH
ncbi:unnamed protein product [Soboliphyme baturini]|uniref:RING-type E3 ubiquitin transferase n=1 Tax=Soboliphyme baturini TaxID=241478 RepID=A0A183IB81_9BILA|nr:unnamed protein product [Soboliphyme baturini]